MARNAHASRRIRILEDVPVLERILLVVCIALAPLAAAADGVPVQFYVSINDNGLGGNTIGLAPDSGQRTYAVWSDYQGAAGGNGAISIQDVLFRASGDITITGFTCALPECIVGNRSDPRTPASFPARELVLTAGDDEATSPGLTGKKKLGDLVIDVGAAPGAVALAGGTALDADTASGVLQIAELPNGGVLLVPEPARALLMAFGLSTLVWIRWRAAVA